MRSRNWFYAAVSVAVPAVALAGGCGDDDTVDSSDTTSSTTGGGATSSSKSTSTATTTSTKGSGGSGATGGDGGSSVGGAGGMATGGAGGMSTGGAGGGTGGAGGGTGGAGGAPANDACPGDGTVNAVAVGAVVTVTGSTVNATDDYTTFCADTTVAADAKDVVYAFNLAAAGTVTVTLDDAPGFDGVISLRDQSCTVRAGGDNCVNLAADGESVMDHYDAGQLWVVVDGANNTAGSFSLTVGLAAATCGDGVINTGEECDPPVIGTCDTDCTFAPPPPDAFEDCPGEVHSIGMGVTQIGPRDTTIYLNDYDPAAPCATEVGGHDHVYQVTPTVSGNLTITVGNDPAGVPYCPDPIALPLPAGCWDANIYVKTGTCTGTQLACADSASPAGASTVEQLTIPVTAGTTYWVFVDGYNAEFYSYGLYNLSLNLQP